MASEPVKHITKSVQEPWFSLIKSGTKTIEGRLNKGDFAEIRAGDLITWIGPAGSGNRFTTRVMALYYHKSFASYLRARTLKACLPGITTLKAGVDVYYRYYSKQDEKKYGIVAIKLQVLD